jgi:hypothetical protein
MTSRTAWVAGLGQGLTFGAAFANADINASSGGSGLANGSSVLSSAGDITNGTALDQLCDISFRFTIASSTIAAGANIAFWLYVLNQDGIVYGDNQLTAGTAAAITPAFPPCATVGIPAVASTTNMYGATTGIIIPPGTFRFAMQNNSGFAFSNTIGSQACKYRTYNQNLNA